MEEAKKFKNAMTLLAEIETLYEDAPSLEVRKFYLQKAIDVHTAFGSVEGAIASAREAYYKTKEVLEKNAKLLEEIHRDYKSLCEKERVIIASKETETNA
jgi:hypothetical protein